MHKFEVSSDLFTEALSGELKQLEYHYRDRNFEVGEIVVLKDATNSQKMAFEIGEILSQMPIIFTLLDVDQRVCDHTMYAQGNNYFPKVLDLMENPAFQLVVSWEKFCEFSRCFTNNIYSDVPESELNMNVVYLDNSGGFKCRGAWHWGLFPKPLPRYNYSMKELKPDPKYCHKHWHGEWQGYHPRNNALFLFESCNENTLIGLVRVSNGQKIAVDVYADNAVCNYVRFFTD